MRILPCTPRISVTLPLPNRSLVSLLACACIAGALALLPTGAVAAFHADFESRLFAEAPDLYAKDHSLVQHTDGIFHLFYSVGQAGEAWNLPGNEIDIGHATSSDLVHWEIQPRILPIDPARGWKSRNVWAPHVLRADLEIAGQVWPYLMAYTGVDSSRNQQIGIAVSADLFDWTDLSVDAAAYRPQSQWAAWDPDLEWQNCRDPFVFLQGNELVMLVSVQTVPEYLNLGTRGAIGMATSTDGLNWTDRPVPLVVNDHWTLMASSHMARSPETGLWHLYYARPSTPGGVHMLTSAAAVHDWSFTSDVTVDSAAISTEITDLGNETVIFSRAVDFIDHEGRESRAIHFDDLVWTADGPSVTRSNPFWMEWALVEGALGAMPTYGDRPGARDGIPSNVDGLFWVNTAENHSGPYAEGCATCGPEEELTGVLRSRTFVARGTTMRLLVGGSASPLAYVALIDSARAVPVRIEYGLGTDVMSERGWDLSPLLGRTLYLEIVDRDPAGHVSVDAIEELNVPTVITPTVPAPPVSELRMRPNPATGPVVMSYALGRSSDVVVSIFEARGRLVRRLAIGRQDSGRHEITWDGMTENGLPVPAGTYFFRVALDGMASGLGPGTRLTIIR